MVQSTKCEPYSVNQVRSPERIGFMESFFSWIDHSEKQRRQILDAIDLFKEQDTRDELGLGTIRDAISDLLFPGTGSVQTRARYFFFVPWMYREFETKRITSAEINARVRRYEIKLIDVLAESEDPQGTIGIIARASIRRRPSNIYWAGLGKLGIWNFVGSQEEYHRLFDRLRVARFTRLHNDDGELVTEVKPPWHPGLPPAPPEFPEKADFRLSFREAEYLCERIQCSQGTSLFAFLVRSLRDYSHVPFAWFHDRVAELPPGLADQLSHARSFSEIMHGASFLYNLMVSKKEPRNEELVNVYESALEEWSVTIRARMAELQKWSRDGFWKLVYGAEWRRRPLTERFVNSWIDLVLTEHEFRHLKDSRTARALIEERERQLKKSLARLFNPRARELWSGAAGTAQNGLSLEKRTNASERHL